MKIPVQILLFILDKFQKTRIRKYYNFYKQTLTWDRARIKKLQFDKLKVLVQYARQNVPYYRDILGSNNFDIANFKSAEDLGAIPILTRNDIQINLEKLISDEFKINELEKSSSSGTTGIPIFYFGDKNSLSAGTAAGYFAWSLSGWTPSDKTLHIWGNPTTVAYWNKTKSKLKRTFKNQTNLASTEFNDPQNHQRLYNEIKEANFDCIDGYTTAIYELSKFIERNKLSEISVKWVFTTAENLMEHQKYLIDKNIGPSSDLYGCGEVNGVAIRPIHENKYFIIDPHVFVEVDESKEDYKSILITDLDNKVMPLIRYKVGDLIDNVFEPEPNQAIQFSYFKKILGRESDIIDLPNGKKILPVNIVGGTLFRKIGGISKHKVVWNGKELTFQFETTNEFSLDRARVLIDKEFENYSVPIKINTVDKLLPDKNGKFKYFENIN